MLCTANVTYVNGMETNREVLSQEVTTEAVNKVVAVGTGKNLVRFTNAGIPTIGDGTITLSTGEVLTYTHAATFKATAYTSTDAGCDTKTATGTTVRVGTVAVDPRVIPYGTRMFIVTNDGAYIYGVGTAEDCGGSIKGNRLDLYFNTHSECVNFGVRNCTVYFIG
ncbi:MAG: G5 domain-containing protein [Oscillospiraceae bacterium]|nr:G5 domain-containing protein [Oscillospiraceae bacterium]